MSGDVDPTGQDLKRFLEEDDDGGPVVMLNLLRFKPDGLIGFWRDARKYWSNWPLAY